MQKLCQLPLLGAVLGATSIFLAACSTTPSGADGAQARTERVCSEQPAPTGSRLKVQRVCRNVERESEKKAEDAPEE